MIEAVGSKFLDQRSMDQNMIQLVRLGSSYEVNSIDGKRKEDQTYFVKMSISTHAETMSKNVAKYRDNRKNYTLNVTTKPFVV